MRVYEHGRFPRGGLVLLVTLVLTCAISRRACAKSPYLVKDIKAAGSSAPDWLTKVGDRLFFDADDGVHGRELWVSDGTEAGTYMVVDTIPGSQSGFAAAITDVAGRAFFQAAKAAGGSDIWVSDGTLGGTSFVVNNSEKYSFHQMEALGNLLVFRKQGSSQTVTDLWRTDGTPQGTGYIKNVIVNQMGPSTGSTLFLAGSGPGDSIPGFDLWKTDGTAVGTVLLADLRGAIWITELSDGAGFTGDLSPYGREPWFTDGTSQGTLMLKDIYPGSGWSEPNCWAQADGLLYFNAYNPAIGREPWRTDGTPDGTVLLADLNPSGSGGGCEFVSLNGTLLFQGTHETLGSELWKSDGTSKGTVLLKDIQPGPGSSSPDNLVVSEGKVYFKADDGVHGVELWVTDGTESGTRLVRDIKPGVDDGLDVVPMAAVNGILFFVALGELWAVDTRPDPIPAVSVWGAVGLGVMVLIAGSFVVRAREGEGSGLSPGRMS